MEPTESGKLLGLHGSIHGLVSFGMAITFGGAFFMVRFCYFKFASFFLFVFGDYAGENFLLVMIFESCVFIVYNTKFVC